MDVFLIQTGASRRMFGAIRSSLLRTTHRLKSTVKMAYVTVSTENAPAAIGPYSQAVKTGTLVFCSGSIGFNPTDMTIVDGGVEAQTTQALKNMSEVLKAAGSDISHVVKTTVFLKDMNDFAKVNTLYEAHFRPYKPARSAVEVARLPKDALIEIECIAMALTK